MATGARTLLCDSRISGGRTSTQSKDEQLWMGHNDRPATVLLPQLHGVSPGHECTGSS